MKKSFWNNLVKACGSVISDDVSYMRYIER